MDHAEVIERIELAAAEPDGLARLAAGDTPEAAAVAGHLAGCDACAAELSRTARTAALAREAIRELPDPALRARTLAFVRELGAARPAAATAGVHGAVDAPAAARTGASTEPAAVASPPGLVTVVPSRPSRLRVRWWAAAGAVAVLIAAVAGFVAGGAARPGIAAGGAATTTLHIAQQPDAVLVRLVPTGAGGAAGSVVYSAASGELAVVVSGLPPAPAGAWYACWVEAGGQRQRIGELYLESGAGSWAGAMAGLDQVRAGAEFGVSLVSSSASVETPVLTGGR
jgi:hypothetical protein